MRLLWFCGVSLNVVACTRDEPASGTPATPVEARPSSAPAAAPPAPPPPPPAPPAVPRMNGSLLIDETAPPEGWSQPPDVAGCPSGMARVPGVSGDFCIHRFEVSLESPRATLSARRGPVERQGATRLRSAAGAAPTYGVTWYQAASACLANGWHLCTSSEWEDACDGKPGPGGRAHPVADAARTDVVCNIRQGVAARLAVSGRSPACRTPEGVYDLEGNLWEWVDPQQVAADGTPVIDKRGGGYYSGSLATCAQDSVGSHRPDWDGTIGFRCCVGVR
jgi:hypothetical protein